MMTDVRRVALDEIFTARSMLTRLGAIADDAGMLDGWEDIAGEAWRLHADAADLIDGLRAGDLTGAELDRWLGECEDLCNDAACLPWPDGDDY